MNRSRAVTILVCLIGLLPAALGAVDNSGPGQPPTALFSAMPTTGTIDRLVLAELWKRGTPPSERCSDAVFLRRVFLDAIGTLPTPAEARAFLADGAPDKRDRLVEALLARPEFADYWAMKWSDLLRVKAEFPSNLWPLAAANYHRWIRTALRDGMPYDRFVRTLLTASGSNFRQPPVNFYRACPERTPDQFAEQAALLFLGIRLDDPELDPAKVRGFTAGFAKLGFKPTDEWKEEIVFFAPDAPGLKGPDGQVIAPAGFDGTPLNVPAGTDPRVAVADWLTAPGNPYFARCMANRVWFWLLGRGILHEPDDMRPGKVPWNAELLSHLERVLVDSRFDVRALFRAILTSGTYQLSSVPNRWNVDDDTGFSRYRLRRMEAEVLVDAIAWITGSTDSYTSQIPEPFTVMPADQRAIALPDGSITSPVLELFGRPERNTAFESERVSDPSIVQIQHLLNSSRIQQQLEQGGGLKQLAKSKQPIVDLYLRILSRFPTDSERAIAQEHVKTSADARAAFIDLAWALINSHEFIIKH